MQQEDGDARLERADARAPCRGRPRRPPERPRRRTPRSCAVGACRRSDRRGHPVRTGGTVVVARGRRPAGAGGSSVRAGGRRAGVRDVAAVHVGVACSPSSGRRRSPSRRARGGAAHLDLDRCWTPRRCRSRGSSACSCSRPSRPTGFCRLWASEVMRIPELQRAGGGEARAGVEAAARPLASPRAQTASIAPRAPLQPREGPLGVRVRDRRRPHAPARPAAGRRRARPPSARPACPSAARSRPRSDRARAARAARTRRAAGRRAGGSAAAGGRRSRCGSRRRPRGRCPRTRRGSPRRPGAR